MIIGELFDPKRLAPRWNAEPVQAAPKVHPKLIEVVMAPDKRADARTLLTDIRRAVERDLPAQRALLTPFLQEAEELLQALDTKGEGVDRKATCERAVEVLWRIEDLLEIYYLFANALRR